MNKRTKKLRQKYTKRRFLKRKSFSFRGGTPSRLRRITCNNCPQQFTVIPEMRRVGCPRCKHIQPVPDLDITYPNPVKSPQPRHSRKRYWSACNHLCYRTLNDNKTYKKFHPKRLWRHICKKACSHLIPPQPGMGSCPPTETDSEFERILEKSKKDTHRPPPSTFRTIGRTTAKAARATADVAAGIASSVGPATIAALELASILI